MSGTRHWPPFAVLVGLCATGLGSWALADGFGPGQPTTVVVGDPRGEAPRDRVDADRLGRSPLSLPSAPKEIWRRELAGGVTLSPVVDAQGGIVAALSSPDLVRLDRDGQQAWRLRLGGAPVSVPPAIASDGSIVAITEDGILWSVSAGGALRFTVDLATPTKKTSAAPLARSDGSVVVAGDEALLVVAADGSIIARAALAGRPDGGILPDGRGGVLVSSLDGEVWRWSPPGQPRRVGELGGRAPGGLSKVSERTAVAVVDRERVVAIDLISGAVTLLLSSASVSAPLEDTVTLSTAGELWATSVVGEWVAVDARGQLVDRGALEKLPAMFGADAGVPAIFRRVELRSSPPLIVDPAGRVAFARNSGKVGVVDSSGEIHTATSRQCARPIAILPAGPSRFVVACRSGAVALFGDP